VLRRVALLVGFGAVLGSVFSWWASKFVTALIYGLNVRDALTLVSSVIILIVVAVAATCLPTYRATRTDPGFVLRDA